MSKNKQPAWVSCPSCEDYLCTIHKYKHVYDCDCPAVEEWYAVGLNPYHEKPAGEFDGTKNM